MICIKQAGFFGGWFQVLARLLVGLDLVATVLIGA